MPKAIVSAGTNDKSVQSIIDEMRGKAGGSNVNSDSSQSKSEEKKTEEVPKKKGVVPQGIVSK